MSKSDFTKGILVKLWICRAVDFAILFLPIIIYALIGFSYENVSNTAKIIMVGTIVVSLILVIFNLVAQKRLRCPLWIILIGLFICIKEMLLPLIIILAVGSILDDLVLTPLIQYYRTKYIASKTIDEREDYDNKLRSESQAE